MKRWMGWIGAGVATLTAFGLNMPSANAAVAASSLRNANPTNTSAAGYVVLPPSTVTTNNAKDSFKVPALNCTSSPSLSGMSVGAFVQSTAPALTFAAVWATCQSGAAVYYGALEANGGTQYNTTFTPHVGDSIVVSATLTSSSAVATLKDATQAKSAKVSATTGGTTYAALDGITALLASGSQIPVPTFTKVPLKGSLDGMTPAAIHAVAIDMKATTVVQIHTGALNTAGNGWAELFKHN